MTDPDTLQQFIGELQKAVDQGHLPRDILDVARGLLIVGGDMINSQAIIGNNNVLNVYASVPVPSEQDVERDEQTLLVEALDTLRREQIAEREQRAEEPYPGLRAFRLRDADLFFGRQGPCTELIADLERKKVIWLHGRSGSGKSSLIQAGLVPALLDKGALAIVVRAFDEFPTTALKKTVLKRCWSPELQMSDETLLRFLARLDKVLKGQPIYVFFDQFEEFVSKVGETKQVEFARELTDCLADLSLAVHFVFSLRSDYFGDTSILRERLDASASREYLLRPLKLEDARRAITGPLERFGISYENGLVDAVLAYFGTSEVDSPQLQLVCEKLFHVLPGDQRQITFQHYRGLGEAQGIIKDYLKQVLRDQQVIPRSQLKAATYILSTLVTPDGKRDRKRLYEWYADERLRLLTFGWRADETALPIPDSALAMHALHPTSVANFMEQVRNHVSAQGEELRHIVDDMLKEYVRRAQKGFVDEVVLALRNARLLHEIPSDEGELSYELIHDHLIEEIISWLDEDERSARELRNKLTQAQLDFRGHRLLLEPKELEIISSQLGNPKLLLQESDKRLLLLSGAAHGSITPWLELSGSSGLGWLREACQADDYGESVHLGAAALLGAVDDVQTFHQLSSEAEGAVSRSRKSLFVEMLAHYLHHASQGHPLPRQLAWPVFLRQAFLRVRDGAAIRARMRKVASFTATFCVFIMMTSVFVQAITDPTNDTPRWIYAVATIFVGGLGFFAASLFAEITTSAMLISRRWGWLWQALILASLGSLLGIFYLYILSGQGAVWFEGGIISLALLLIGRRLGLKPVWYSVALAIASGVLIFGVSRLAIQDTVLEEMGAALSTGVFASVYFYAASRLE